MLLDFAFYIQTDPKMSPWLLNSIIGRLYTDRIAAVEYNIDKR